MLELEDLPKAGYRVPDRAHDMSGQKQSRLQAKVPPRDSTNFTTTVQQ
jgi:hypothetical protein